MFKRNNQNINSGIFQGNSFSPLFVYISNTYLDRTLKQAMDIKVLLKK